MNTDSDIELDLDKIRNYAESREQENLRFCASLNESNPEKIDALVHQLNKEVSDQIDCTLCGNCCKQATPILSERDLTRLSVASKIDKDRLEKELTVIENEERLFKSQPCVFLKDNKCSVYALRPDDCRNYPHLNKDEFTNRLWNVLEHYPICPIVFNVFEKMKKEVKLHLTRNGTSK